MKQENQKYRKHIRLKDFDYKSDGAYFITICTDSKQKLIRNGYATIIKDELADLRNRFPEVVLDYYVLMADHLHFILFLTDSRVSIPQIIQAFKSLTTLKIKGSGYKGKRFWQSNYFEHVVRNEKALNKIRKYIIENPLVAELDIETIYDK